MPCLAPAMIDGPAPFGDIIAGACLFGVMALALSSSVQTAIALNDLDG